MLTVLSVKQPAPFCGFGEKEFHLFAWGIHVIEQPTQLVLTVPFPWLFLLLCTVVGGIPILLLICVRGHYWRKGLILAALCVFYGMSCYTSELTLDVPSNTGTLRQFKFFHWSEEKFPLNDVDGLIVRTGSTSSALLLQFRGGSVWHISNQDQTSGKQQAAYKVNAWLEKNRM